jgi:hypothetical protein
MIHGTVVKDSQNPYRTGVLVGNHVEDRFGQDLAQRDVRFLLDYIGELMIILETLENPCFRTASQVPSWKLNVCI